MILDLMHSDRRFFFVVIPLVAALAAAACGDDNTPTTPTPPTPTQVTETFSETLNVNGGRTHVFQNSQTGAVSATLSAVAPDGTILGLAIGTWNGTVQNPPADGACQLIIAKDNAAQGNSVVGNASIGGFCARVFDVGRLTGPVDYTITVTHY